MFEWNKSREYDEDQEKRLLIEDIIECTKEILISDPQTVVMTYEHAINMMHDTDYDDVVGLIRRSTLRSVDGLSKILAPEVIEDINPSETLYYHLIKKDQDTGNKLVYIMTDLHTTSGESSSLMTISVGGAGVHRIRGVLMTSCGQYSSTNELQPLWDEFAHEANRLVDDNLVNVVSPLLHGLLPTGHSLQESLNTIRASLEFHRTDIDVDEFIHNLEERYNSMRETNEFREQIGMDNNEMTIEQLLELKKYLNGESRTLDIYSR